MMFKLIVFISILIAVAVLSMRAYRSSVQSFEQRQTSVQRDWELDSN